MSQGTHQMTTTHEEARADASKIASNPNGYNEVSVRVANYVLSLPTAQTARVPKEIAERVALLNEFLDGILARDGMTEEEFYNTTASLAVKDAYKFARVLRTLLHTPDTDATGGV